MQTIIKELLDHEGDICISLVLPTSYKAFAERDRIRIMMKNGVHDVEKSLEKKYDKAVYKPLCETLHGLVKQIDFDHPPQGVGIFITSGFSRLIYFPFSVKAKVVISDTFELQDILYNLDKLMVYYVLLLSKKDTRLFKGMGKVLQELVNDKFPKTFEDLYEEDKPSYHALYTKDPSQVIEKRVNAFLREVHHQTAAYVKDHPLVLVGIDKYISSYKSLGKHPPILGELHGHHDRLAIHEVSKLVWPIVKEYQERSEADLCKVIANKVGSHEAVYGVEEVVGKIDEAYDVHLVVENDFEIGGYLDTGDGSIVLKPFDPLRYREVPNVIEHLVEKVLKRKNGKVDVVTRGLLKDYDRIVLITKL